MTCFHNTFVTNVAVPQSRLDTKTGLSRNQDLASVRTLSIADIVKKRMPKVDLG